MARIQNITVGGREYPCRTTMGAMLRFKNETGREVTELDVGSMTDLTLWLWCCVASACSADGVAFDMTVLQFADLLLPGDLKSWVAGWNEGAVPAADGSAEKKSGA